MPEIHKDERPDVSFVVAAHNVAPYIEAAVHSALAQTDVTVEVIVIDDASTDATPDVVARIAEADPRVILVRQASNAGPAAARNLAIARATGVWLAILDGDDVLLPDRSRRLIDIAEANEAQIVADNFERFRDEDKPALSTMIPKSEHPYLFFVDQASFITANIPFARAKFSLGAIKPMFRTDFLRSALILYRDDLPIGEDYHVCLDALQAGARFVVSSETFYRYRLRDGSQSWRLKEDHVIRLQKAHAETEAKARLSARDVREAAHRFGRELEKVRAFTHVVEQAKQRNVVSALWEVAATPGIWRFVMRFGSQGVARRLGLIA